MPLLHWEALLVFKTLNKYYVKTVFKCLLVINRQLLLCFSEDVKTLHYVGECRTLLDLLADLYKQTSTSKVLIFSNSRGLAEVVAVKLRLITTRVNGHANYLPADKVVREYVEHLAKNNQRQPFCIACTATLELGIDIGPVDKVVQIDAVQSVASLVQRVGRSGQRDDKPGQLLFYATNPWSLLHSLACWQLYQECFVEPPRPGN